jgi:hypothetical protein
MGQLANFTEGKVLDHILKTASYSPPATVYLGMSTADPTADGSGWADPTYTGYARKAITFGAAGATTPRSIIQNADVNFDQCTNGTSTCSHWGLWDAETNGNLMAYGSFNVAKVVVAGNTPKVASGGVAISINAGVMFTAFAHTMLDWLFRAQALAQPTHVKIGLSTTTPADGGTNVTEPVGNNYSQKEFDTWNAASANPRVAKNNGTILMATPSGSWGLITYAVLYLDTTKAYYGTVPNQTPDNGDTVEWLDQQFSVGLQ